MSITITRTKVLLPRRRPDLLSRQRLLSMLDDLLEYRLTLITAPAGYGKTSLLVDLAHRVEYPVCWLALDPLDQDLHRFLHYFTAAVREQFPDFGTASISLLNSTGEGQLHLEQLLRTIINDLYDHVPEHFALVLDDYHLVDSSPSVNQFINRFSQEMDENCHLVIASRSLLSLPDLPLMVGRSQVKGLSFEELAFDPREIKSLLERNYHQTLTDQESERIHQETEGWITGLLLSAEADRSGMEERGRAARAAGIDLYDYLAQQVLERQPADLRVFLLRSCWMEEFNEDLCQQVLDNPPGKRSWQDLIGELLQKNLFVQPVDNGGTWLRYHHLFRDFLQQQYRKNHPEKLEGLLRRLVEVYAGRGWWEKAHAVCQQVGDPQLTIKFLDRASPALVHSGRTLLLAAWLAELEDDLIFASPSLLARQGALTSMMGDPQAGLHLLNQAAELMADQPDPDQQATILIRRATSHRLLGQYQQGLADSRDALSLVEGNPTSRKLCAEAEREIGLNHRRLGNTQEAKTHLENARGRYLREADHKNAAFVEMDLGSLAMNEGDYATARTLYRQAYQIWEELGNLSQLVGLCNNLGVLDHITGDYLQAFRWFSRALKNAHQTGTLRGEAFTLTSLGDLALDLNAFYQAHTYYQDARKLANQAGILYLKIYLEIKASSLARKKEQLQQADKHLRMADSLIADRSTGVEKGEFHLESGRLLLSKNDFTNAVCQFESALEIFQEINAPAETAICLLYLARLADNQNAEQEAERYLSKAREAVLPLGVLHPLVPAFSDCAEFLSGYCDRPGLEDFLSDLNSHIADFQTRVPVLLKSMDFKDPPRETGHPPQLDIRALGRIRLLREGEPVTAPDWSHQKTVRELLFYLLSQPGGATREEICAVFWPESSPEKLKKQFKNALYRLRRAVGREAILYHQPTRLYYFNRDLPYRYDVEEFQQAADQAANLSDPGQQLTALQRAAARYRHPFAPTLEGSWVEPVRYGLYREYERLMLQLGKLHLSLGKPTQALETSKKLLESVSGQEDAWRLAMQAYAARGDRSGIDRVYQQCKTTLANQLNTEPSRETRNLYEQLMA